jgi:hypothetical protein
MKELEISLPIFPPKKCISKDDSSNLSTVGLYIIQKLREEDLKEMLPSLSLDESNLNLENVAEELNSKYGIVELILNNRDILVNLDEFYEEECQLSLLNWAWNIHRKFFGRKNETNSTGNNLETDTNANIFLNKEFLFKNKCLNNKAEILLFNILNIFEIFPIKPDDLKSLNFIEKLRDIKKDMKSRNLLLYKKIKKLINFWKKMIKFFDSQRKSTIPETKATSQNPKFFDITLNQKRQLEDCDTEQKDKNKRSCFLPNKETNDNMSSNISLDETESGEHKIKKKNVTWKSQESLVERIEFDPMNAPLEI